MKILRLSGTDPWLNLATEEYIFRRLPAEDYLLLWRNDNTIVVGLHQNTQEEIDAAFVEEKGIRVARRITGGGSVYHDLGNLNFSFITKAEDAARLTMSRFTLPIVRAISGLGIKAETGGRNDILAEGHKISGNAQALYKQRILHHGTLLFDSDLSVLSRALRVQPEKFLSKGIKSVRARVANIKDLLPDPNFSIHDLAEKIIQSVSRESPAEPFDLSPADLEEIQILRDKKYASWEWNFGESPPFTFKNKQKYVGGFLEVQLVIQEGRLAGCRFLGDFLALRPAAEVAEKLLGQRYTRPALDAALRSLPLAEYFGGIHLEEVLDCLLGTQPPGRRD